MGTKANTIEITDFTGGRNSFDPEFLVPPSQAIDLQNVNLLDRGFTKRNGNVAFNSSAMVSGSTAIVGMGYIKFNSGTEFLNAIAGTKFFTSSGLTGTMADATGGVTITSGQNNIWTPVNFNNTQIWFGGAPDAPIVYNGSGNATALGGSPPSAVTAFSAANRVFAISTSANPSRIQWPILADPTDWTGTGSGTQDVQKNDGEALQFGVPIDADTAILFKNSSTHLMPLTKAPFPVYTLQTKFGAAGHWSYVFVDGEIYFITPNLKMKSTRDGVNFQNYPQSVDDLWNSINTSRSPYIRGLYIPNLYQIHWFVSTGSGTTNSISIIWDLRRKAWLYNPQGFTANVSCLVQNMRPFTGHYDGKMYEQDKSATSTDASEASPHAINAYWQTPALRLSTLDGRFIPYWIDIVALSESATVLTVDYGFDFSTAQKSSTFSLVTGSAQWDVAQWDVDVWGGQTSIRRKIHTLGHGENMNMRVGNGTASQGFTIQAISMRIKTDQPGKVIQNAA